MNSWPEISTNEMLSILTCMEKEVKKPEIPEDIRFPFMVVLKRRKLSERSTWYLAAFVVSNLSDYAIMKRNLKHKVYPEACMMFDAPQWMVEKLEKSNRMLWYRFQNWGDLSRVISQEERNIIPDLEKMFPCPVGQLREKSGQYRLIF